MKYNEIDIDSLDKLFEVSRYHTFFFENPSKLYIKYLKRYILSKCNDKLF